MWPTPETLTDEDDDKIVIQIYKEDKNKVKAIVLKIRPKIIAAENS